MQGIQILFIIGIIALIAFSIWRSGERRKRLGQWAASNGLSFSSSSDRSFRHQYPSFGCLHRGHSESAYNLASGRRNGRTVRAFDYRYVTGHGKNRTTHRFSAVIVDSQVPLRSLSLRSEGLFDKVTEFFGLDDIDFESAEFSRTFHVRSSDKKWAYDVLHQRTMAFLLESPRFSLEFDRNSVIAWRNRRFDTQTFDAALAVIEGVLDRIPKYVHNPSGNLAS